MDKLDKLKKLQELKENGTISEEEFENEKKKILNENEITKFKGNKKISIIGFILSVILLVITIAFIAFCFYWYNEMDDISMDYYIAMNEYLDYKEEGYTYRYFYEDAKEEYEDLKEIYDEREGKYKFFKYGSYVTGGLCIAALGVGILFIERKKKDNKNEKRK